MQKWIRTAALAGILLFAGVIIAQLQVAFGWTNPLQNPPGGNGVIGATNGQVFIGAAGTTPSSTAILALNGTLSLLNNLISDVNTPMGAKDAANKAYVDAAVATGGSAGAGSMVLYYKMNNGVNTIVAPTCPVNWTQQMSGYGPHYIGVISYDWLYGGTGGTGGGFGGGGGGGPPPPTGGGDPTLEGIPPAPGSGAGLPAGAGYSFTVGDIAFGSDSVCSQDRYSVVKLNQLYLNATTTNLTTWYADACSTDVNRPGILECNLCIVCVK